MRSLTSAAFRARFSRLSEAQKSQARKAFRIWLADPHHPSLHFKKIHGRRDIWSVRFGTDWRAVCIRQGDDFLWYWIGTHAEYDRLLKKLE